MDGKTLRNARHAAKLTQQQTAELLGVTQAYLSMLEHGERPVSDIMARRASEHLPIDPVVLPFTGERPKHFEDALGALGYPGFLYLRHGKRMNPAELLLLALDTAHLPARAVEGLPWIPLAFPNLDWNWLMREAKLRGRQNRLGYVLDLAQQAAEAASQQNTSAILREKSAQLYGARLAVEDTLCRESMTNAERNWLKVHRPPEAVSWGLLTDLKLPHLNHVHL